MGMLVSGLAALLLLLSRDSAPALFTSDPAVIQACSVLMLPLAALLLSERAVPAGSWLAPAWDCVLSYSQQAGNCWG
jgi:hypothetical protein